MFQGFWRDLPRPIIGLSPMDGVTDHPYRHIHKKYGQPDVVMTEFTSAEGVVHNATRLFRDFRFDESQRPIVAQIFGADPHAFRTTALLLCYLGFDGIDINMGCPAKSVREHGCGAALILTPKLAQEIVQQTRAGVYDWMNGRTLDDCPELNQDTKDHVLALHAALPESYQQRQEIPVSVKTRIGYDHPVIEDWIPNLLEMEPAAISLHGRTLKQMYTGQANWEEIAKAAEIVHQTPTLILGNGDIDSANAAQERIQATGVDGVLIGRASYGNPWIFTELRAWREHMPQPPAATPEDKLQLAMEHSQLYEESFPHEHFLPMRKNLAWYVKGFPNASNTRVALMMAQSATDVAKILATPQETDTIQDTQG